MNPSPTRAAISLPAHQDTTKLRTSEMMRNVPYEAPFSDVYAVIRPLFMSFAGDLISDVKQVRISREKRHCPSLGRGEECDRCCSMFFVAAYCTMSRLGLPTKRRYLQC